MLGTVPMQRVLMLAQGTSTRSVQVTQDAGFDAFVIGFCRHLQTLKLQTAEPLRWPLSWQLRRDSKRP